MEFVFERFHSKKNIKYGILVNEYYFYILQIVTRLI